MAKRRYDPVWCVTVPLKTLKRICKVLELDPNEFMIGKDLDVMKSLLVQEFLIQSAEAVLSACEIGKNAQSLLDGLKASKP